MNLDEVYLSSIKDKNYIDFLRRKNIIRDSIDLVDDELIIDYDKKPSEKSLDTHFGTTKKKFKHFQKKVGSDVVVKSVYKFTKENHDVVVRLKQSTDKKQIESFVKRTAIFLYKHYKNYHIDYIIIPKDSYLLINEIANELSLRLNLENPIPLDIIEKTSPKYITIDFDDPTINDWVVEELEYILKISRKRNYFKMKEVKPSIRKYLKNTHQLNNFYLHKLSDKNILIVDDIITSDKTIKDVSDLLFFYEANNVHACTIFTRKS